MAIKVGITGGIGSGKSFISRIFEALSIPTYDADKQAKELMNSDPEIREKLIAAFGANTYNTFGVLDRSYLSEVVFKDEEKLKKLNDIVHPIVINHGNRWGDEQKGPYSLKEAALLFESGSYKNLDYTILVTSPLELRIKRVMERDHTSREQVESRISKQMSDQEKIPLADIVIINDEQTPLLPQIMDIHNLLLSKAESHA